MAITSKRLLDLKIRVAALHPELRKRWLADHGVALAQNAVSGLIASLLSIAYCLSFSALLFQGALAPGLGAGLWALLVGTAVAGLYVSLTTSLPPVEAGPDNPAVAVLAVLAGTVAGPVLASGGDGKLAADYVLISFSLATFVTGAVLYALGRLKLGQYVRFIPYPVIGGFLAASGFLLAKGGFEVMTGADLALDKLTAAVPRDRVPMVLLGVAFAIVVYALRARTGSMYVLPVSFIAGSLLIDLVLWTWGLMGEESGWFITGASKLEPWMPLRTLAEKHFDWSIFLGASIEIAVAAGVTVIALLLDVTGLEVARTKSGDLDWEFRTNGAANMIAAPLGGVMGNLSLNGSRLLDATGGLARISGVFASLVVAAIVLTGIDLPGIVPKPVLAGLLIYLGLVVLAEMALRSPAHGAWKDFVLALAIMFAIIIEGYLLGVVFGFIAACLMFAVSYSRVEVIRRHLTRSVIASTTDRAQSDQHLLKDEGERIHVFWLSGYIFFGSSNRLFESIRDAMERARDLEVCGLAKCDARRFAVLDFSNVSGFDSAAVLSLIKLCNHAAGHCIVLAFAGLDTRLSAALRQVEGLAADGVHRTFNSRDAALAWCEEQLLDEASRQGKLAQAADIEAWLAAEIGGEEQMVRLTRFLVRRDLGGGEVLYEQGTASDTIDLVISGKIAVLLARDGVDAAEPWLVVRRMSMRTVVGEMGFFRGTPRAARVAAEGPASVYTLTREAFERLKAEDEALARAFLEFIVRTLSDRLAFANQGISALS